MTKSISMSPRAWAELLLLSLIWGGSFLSIAIALREIGVITAIAHRVFWAALLLWCVVLVLRIPLPENWRSWVALAVMGLLNNAIPFLLMAWGQLHIESGLTSIFNATTAIFGVLLAALFFADERLTPRKLIGVTLGFLGVSVAIGLDALAQFNVHSLAQLAVIGGTLSYACASVWGRKFLSNLHPIMAATGMLTGSTLITVPLAFWLEGPPDLALSPETWTAICYYAGFATAGAYLLYYRVLAMAGSANLMLVTLIMVPVAVLLGALVLGESLSPNSYAGFTLLAIGLLILDGRLSGRLRNPFSI